MQKLIFLIYIIEKKCDFVSFENVSIRCNINDCVHIARLTSNLRKVCFFLIYCSLIWFNYVSCIKTKKCFWFVYRCKMKFIMILSAYYSLDSLNCFKSHNNNSALHTYIFCMYVLALEWLHQMNRFCSLKQAQHFNVHDSNQNKKRKKRKIYSVYNFPEHVQHLFWKLISTF